MGIHPLLTVITAAATNDLTTLATVKQEFGITGTSEDVKLARWITTASAKIATECNRVFGKEQVSEQFRVWCWKNVIVLKRRPVTSIVSITENDIVLTTTDYELDLDLGLLYRLRGGQRCHWVWGKLVVVYFGGYVLLDGLPYDLEQACIKLVGHYRLTADRDPFIKGENVDIPGVRSKNIEWWVGSLAAGTDTRALPPEVLDLLEKFRDPISA